VVFYISASREARAKAREAARHQQEQASAPPEAGGPEPAPPEKPAAGVQAQASQTGQRLMAAFRSGASKARLVAEDLKRESKERLER